MRLSGDGQRRGDATALHELDDVLGTRVGHTCMVERVGFIVQALVQGQHAADAGGEAGDVRLRGGRKRLFDEFEIERVEVLGQLPRGNDDMRNETCERVSGVFT